MCFLPRREREKDRVWDWTKMMMDWCNTQGNRKRENGNEREIKIENDNTTKTYDAEENERRIKRATHAKHPTAKWKKNNKLVSFCSSVLLNTFPEKEKNHWLNFMTRIKQKVLFIFISTFFLFFHDVPLRSANHDDLLFVICRKTFFFGLKWEKRWIERWKSIFFP